MNQCENCFANILSLIDTLQRNAEDNIECDNSCTRGFLGNTNGLICLNTRPITLYHCDNSLFEIPYQTNEGTTLTSSVFRVKNIKGNCITVTILAPNPTPTDLIPYVSTNQTATINLDCVCALKCLRDTTINI